MHPHHRGDTGDDRRGERGALSDRVGRILFVQDVHRGHLEILDQHTITLIIRVGLDSETQVQATEIIVSQIRLQAAAAAAFREDIGRLPVESIRRRLQPGIVVRQVRHTGEADHGTIGIGEIDTRRKEKRIGASTIRG